MVTPGAGSGHAMGPGPYTRTPEDVQWLHQFEMAPVEWKPVADHLDGGEALETVDIPSYLDKPLTVEVDTGLLLYRLVQLFGTPNVAPLMAGGEQPPRERRTWQYLLTVTYDPDEASPDRRTEPGEWLVAVYDEGIDLSVGLSHWADADGDDLAARLPEPDGEVPAGFEMPPEETLVGLVQLVSATVEEPVQATHKNRWV